MQRYAVTTAGALLAGAAYYVAPTTNSKRVFGVDDMIGISIAKEIIKPLCCAIFGGVVWYSAYNFFYGSILNEVKSYQQKVAGYENRLTIMQNEINGFKPQLHDIQAIASGCKEKTDQMDNKLSQIVPQVAIACGDIAKMRESIEADRIQMQQSEVYLVFNEVLGETADIERLHEIAQTTLKKGADKKNKEQKPTLFGFNLFGSTHKK